MTPKGRASATHAIAKVLVTTNPNLLTPAQRMGAIAPLLRLCREPKSSNLEQFEALLALTNIASVGDDEKARIVNERGIHALEYDRPLALCF